MRQAAEEMSREMKDWVRCYGEGRRRGGEDEEEACGLKTEED